MFDWYFGLQLGCGAVALITALSFADTGTKRHRLRAATLCLALVGAAGGYAIEKKVSQLGVDRNTATDLFLAKHYEFHHPDTEAEPAPQPVTQKQLQGLKAIAEEARASFGMWHGISMLVNRITLLLVTVAMALTALLPPQKSDAPLPISAPAS